MKTTTAVAGNARALGRPSVLRRMNALRVLEVLRASETCSRADLVRQLGLSAPTITSVVRDLLDADLVEPLGEGVSKGGRPPDMIRFKAERGSLAAVQLTATELRLLLTDLNGREIAATTMALRRRASTPEIVCGMVRDGVRAMLDEAGLHKGSLLAVVVGVPAITDVANGVVMSVSTLQQWRSVPLRAMLRRLLRCAVVIENDTNLAAMGEHFCGAAQLCRSVTLVSIGANVGAGILLNGRLHHGAQWSAGEVGYLRLPQTSRKAPTIDAFGELETMVTISGLLREWERGAGAAGGTAAARRTTPAEQAIRVLDLAAAGQGRARAVVRTRAQMVADLVVNLSFTLNPELLVLSGVVGGHPALLAAVQAELAGISFGVPPIVAGELGEEATLWGAVAVALEALPGLLLPEFKADADLNGAGMRRQV